MLFDALATTKALAVHAVLARTTVQVCTQLYRFFAAPAPCRTSVRVVVSQKQLLWRQAIDVEKLHTRVALAMLLDRFATTCDENATAGSGTTRVMLFNERETP